jgi:hypothetical protein
MTTTERTEGFRLLERFAPLVLKELRDLFPEAAGRFISSGQTLGPAVERADAVAALAGSRLAFGLCNQAIEKAQARLHTADQATTWSCVLTAVSGSALLATALLPWPQMLNLMVGALALGGALAGIAGKRFAQGLGGSKLPEESRNLGRLSQELVRVQVGLAVRLATEVNPEGCRETAELVDKAHVLCRDMGALAAALGLKGLDETHVHEIIETARRDAIFADVEAPSLCAVDQLMPVNAASASQTFPRLRH